MTFKALTDYYRRLPKIIAIPLLIILAVIISFPTTILMLEYPYEFWLTIKVMTVVLVIIGVCFNHKKIYYNLERVFRDTEARSVAMYTVVFVVVCPFGITLFLFGVRNFSSLSSILFALFLIPVAIFVNIKYRNLITLTYVCLVFLGLVSLVFSNSYIGSKGALMTFFKKESVISSDYQKALRNLNLQVVNESNVASSYAMEYIDYYNADIRSKSVEILAPFSRNSNVREGLQAVALSPAEKPYIRGKAICSIVENSHYYDDFLFELLKQSDSYMMSHVRNLSVLPCMVSFSKKTGAELIGLYITVDDDGVAYGYRRQVINLMKNNTELRRAWADEISQGRWAKLFRYGLVGAEKGTDKQISVLADRSIILGDAYVENVFLKLMRSDDEDDISDAFHAMENAYNYHPEVEKILVSHLQSSDDDVVSEAKKLLLNYRITDWNSITAVLRMIDNGSAYDRERAFKLLARSLPAYVKELDTTISEQKQNIIKNVREKAARQCQHDMDADVKQVACQTLEVIE